MLVRWKHKLFDQRYLEAEIKGMVQVVTDKYSRLKAKRRSIPLLVALRRYRNRMGHWPDTLDEIRQSVPEGILADAQHATRFTYWRMTGGFELYSTGQNRIDESCGGDDWLIWSTRWGSPNEGEKEGEWEIRGLYSNATGLLLL